MEQTQTFNRETGKESGKESGVRASRIIRSVENNAAKIPVVSFLGLAAGAMAISIGLEYFTQRRRDPATFVGLWVPTFLLLGIYSKFSRMEENGRSRPYTH